jgi:site-specific DNA-methyltransferase (adenine-specific)/adenine-specific DNA-methyltransferase
MNKLLTKDEIEFLVNLIQNGDEIPFDYKYKLFPTKQKEYELAYAGKMRKEDILANEDGVFPVPLQVEKVFNGNEYEAFEDGWKNMIVFGDNLQFLKTVYENKDPLIKDKVKGKVKLIYIDPPFATEEDFSGNDSQKAYTDKKKGAEFVEFLRKRLIVAKEILDDDGSIFVHLDYKKAHYIKLVLDEIFGERNLVNELIWHYRRWSGNPKSFQKMHENIFWYKKSENYTFNKIMQDYANEEWIEDTVRGMVDGKLVRLKDEDGNYIKREKQNEGVLAHDVWEDINFIAPTASERIGYPTQKPEALIERIIKASSNEGDIVLDFFGGSGSTMAVAEKLGRKWITCDLGKLAYFTMQKRVLQIQESKDLEDLKKKYGKKAKSFFTASLGSYDLEKTFELERKKYLEFVSGLFGVNLKEYTVSGFSFEGTKDNYPVIIYDYNKYKNSSIDESYLEDLHKNIGKKVGSNVYIVAPINFIDFVDDFIELDDVRYYFLKIPYHIINEIHKKPFVKVRQPQSKSRVNDIEEAVGFHFKRPPEVKAEIQKFEDEVKLIIKSFRTNELQSDKAKEEKSYENFETLSSVFIDKTYNGKSFEMDEAFFADDLLPKKKLKKKIQIEEEENIIEDLKELSKTGIEISLKLNEVKDQIMVVFTDIYGNDFTQTFTLN